MSKRSDDDMEEDVDVDVDIDDTPVRKHKKHKKHKHRSKKKEEEEHEVEPEEDEDESDIGTPGLKIKIKFGTEDSQGSGANTPPKRKYTDSKKKDTDIFKTKKSDEDTSDEEKEWLNALDSGTLDDNGMLKKAPDLLLMTARQRARLQGQPEEQLMELPSGYKNAELTEEQLQRRQQRAKKRREQAQEKREKDKKQTVERLLKKKDKKRGSAAKAAATGGRSRVARKHRPPGYRYLSNKDGVFISVQEGLPFPLASQKIQQAPAVKLCGVPGCKNPKKYNCSKTGTPLCSLECYKLNLNTVKQEQPEVKLEPVV